MRNWFRIGIVFLLWIINLFVGTGLDITYHVTQYTRWVILIITVVMLLVWISRSRRLTVNRKKLYLFGGMTALFLASSVIHGFELQAVRYLWVYLLVWLLSKLAFTEKDVFWIGLSYGVAGFVVLFLFSQDRVFGGWNENSIAMIGMFSFMVMLIPLYKKRSRWSKVRIVFVALVFAYFINPTNSRASILFLAVGVVFALGFLKRELIIRPGKRLTLFLLAPLIVAVLTILVSRGSFMQPLDAWSMLRFGKPIFNGRDEAWARGMELLIGNFFIGTGDLMMANWHNSAVSVLAPYGVLGYLFWLASFRDILGRAYSYLTDYVVQGCFIGFLIIYFQQSLELGLVSTNPTLIPYIMLGLMLGRIRYLKNGKEDHDELERDHTGI